PVSVSCFCPTSYSSAAALLLLHSFPTRRSSDLFESTSDAPTYRPLYEESLFLVSATDESSARAKAEATARARGTTYDNEAGETRSEEHTSELQSRENLVCRLLLEKKKNTANATQ